MIVDGRGVAPGTVIATGVCIVGGGAAGIAIAMHLAGRGHQVTILESGGLDFDARTNALNQGELAGEDMTFLGTPRPLDATRQRFLGGSTNCWFGWCRPLDPWDFVERPWVAHSGWPIPRSEIEPWFPDAAALVQIGPPDFGAQSWEALGGGPVIVDTPLMTTTMFQFSAPTRFGSVYRDALESNPGIEVYLWSNAVNLDAAPAGERVTGVDVATLDGGRFRVEADTVILATGGVEVPRLLLASNRDVTSGLGNQNGLVGRFFMEHPYMVAGYALFDRPVDALRLYAISPYGLPGSDREVAAVGSIVPTLEGQAQVGSLNVGAMLYEVDPDTPVDRDGDLVSPAQMRAMLGALEGGGDFTLAAIHLAAEQVPNPESRVMLLSDTDELGMPRVAVDWRHSALDRDSLASCLGLLGGELGRLGLGRVLVEPEGVGPWGRDFSVSSHHMGTARMSADPSSGVVDANCRVHGVENLYVAGSAVFPTVGSANPTFTILALALRLAEHLHAEVL